MLEIDEDTGAVLRTFDGLDPDLGQDGFSFQHAPSWTPSGNLLLFVNQGPADEGSWAAEFEVDGSALHEVWHSPRSADVETIAMGHAWRLGNGSSFIDYGVEGLVSEFDEDDLSTWSLRGDEGVRFSQARLMDSYEVR